MKKQLSERMEFKPCLTDDEPGSINWEQLYKRLLLAAYRLSGLRRNDDDAVIARGLSPTDMAQKVIEHFLQGRLPWRPEKGSLLTYLARVLRNDYLDLVTSKEVRTTVSVEGLKAIAEASMSAGDAVDFLDAGPVANAQLKHAPALSDTAASPEAMLLGRERLADLRRLVRGDAALEEVIAAITERDLLTPAEIAADLGTTRADIYNRFKRLRRCLGSLLAKKPGQSLVAKGRH